MSTACLRQFIAEKNRGTVLHIFFHGDTNQLKMAISCQFSKRPILNHGLMGGSSMNGCGGLHFSAGLYRCGGPDLRR